MRIRRAFFDRILGQAVPSIYSAEGYETRDAWQAALASSNVRLQWDPDHDPEGNSVARRAIQLGLRGDVLQAYGTTEILEILDMTPFVASQRGNSVRDRWPFLRTPEERVYPSPV